MSRLSASEEVVRSLQRREALRMPIGNTAEHFLTATGEEELAKESRRALEHEDRQRRISRRSFASSCTVSTFRAPCSRTCSRNSDVFCRR